MTSPDVLVVGAGPTGLTLALQAHDHGATVAVIDRRTEAFRRSRAMIVQSRTLECLRPLGVTAALLERADRSPRATLHLGRRVVDVRLGEAHMPHTSFPHLTMVRQADVEEVLTEALARRGVRVERGVELEDLDVTPARVRAVVRTSRGRLNVLPQHVVGCDGQASTVRHAADIPWEGGPYREEVVLADVELTPGLEPDVLHVVAGRAGLLFLFSLGETASWRLLATRPAGSGGAEFGQLGERVPVTQVQGLIDDAGLPAQVRDMPWSARVRLQHRVAASFRCGPVFLAGDAAHTHSPAAAQGMNTGIVDAVNLGWKLAFADRADPELLGSYDPERRPAARQVAALTHAVFVAEASTRTLPAMVRGTVMPWLAPLIPVVLDRPRTMGAVVTLLSQPWVRYRGSPLSVTHGPTPHGPRPGDRVKDTTVTCGGRQQRLHDLTGTAGVHLLLSAGASPVEPAVLGRHVFAHRISSWSGTGVTAVRPDGHIGFRSAHGMHGLVDWLDMIGAR